MRHFLACIHALLLLAIALGVIMCFHGCSHPPPESQASHPSRARQIISSIWRAVEPAVEDAVRQLAQRVIESIFHHERPEQPTLEAP